MRTSGSFQALQPLMCTFTVSVQKANSNPNQSWNFLAVVTGRAFGKDRRVPITSRFWGVTRPPR